MNSYRKILALATVVIISLLPVIAAFPVVSADLSENWWENSGDLTPDTEYGQDYLDWENRVNWDQQIIGQIKKPNIQAPNYNYVPIGCTENEDTYGSSKIVLFYDDANDKYAIAWDLVRGEEIDNYEERTWVLFTQVYYREPGDTTYDDFDLIAYFDGEVQKSGNMEFEPLDNTKQYMQRQLLYHEDINNIEGDTSIIDPSGTLTPDPNGDVLWEVYVQYSSLKKVETEGEDWYDWIIDTLAFTLDVISKALAVAAIAHYVLYAVPPAGAGATMAIGLASIGVNALNDICQENNPTNVVWKQKNTGIVHSQYMIGYTPDIRTYTDIKEIGYDTSDAWETAQDEPYDTGRCYNTIHVKRFKDVFAEIKIPDVAVPTQSKIIPLKTEYTNFPQAWIASHVTITEHKIEVDVERTQTNFNVIDSLIESEFGDAYWEFNIDPLVDFETSNPLAADPSPDDIPPEAEFDPLTDDYFYKFVDTIDMVENNFNELTGASTANDISAQLVEIYDSASNLECVYPNNFMGDIVFDDLEIDGDIEYNGQTYDGEFYFGIPGVDAGSGVYQKTDITGAMNGLLGTSDSDHHSDKFKVEFEGVPRLKDELPWTMNIELENVGENLQKDEWFVVGEPVIDEVSFEISFNTEIVDLDNVEIAINLDNLAVEVRIPDYDDFNAYWAISAGKWQGRIWSKDIDTYNDLVAVITVDTSIYSSIPSYVQGLDDGNGIYGLEVIANKPDDNYPTLGSISFDEYNELPSGVLYYVTSNEIIINFDQVNEKVIIQKYIDPEKGFDVERRIDLPLDLDTTSTNGWPINLKPNGDVKIRVDTTADHTINILDNKDQITTIFDVEKVRFSCITTSGQIYIQNTDFFFGIATPAERLELFEEYFYLID